jgi:Na+/H+-dicarboxylate symporter/ABC-type amino acid transport substrate-binding protein
MSFSSKILTGLAAGVALGLLVGEHAAVLKVAADGFVKLLQMTVLPFVTVSIVSSLGALDAAHARLLARRVGLVLVGLWAVALIYALLLPLTFPDVENAQFFSTTLVERRAPFNFVDLYIPSNPFYSLANNVVPAVVLFSVILGVALIGVEKKGPLLGILEAVKAALARATRFVVGLTPYGLFAIAATTAGTMSLDQVGRLQVYLIGYCLVALLVALWVLPGLVAALTPVSVREIFALNRNALITAFVAGDLFIVLPVLIGSSRTLMERHAGGEDAGKLPDVIVPASFNFPHAGKLLSVSFVLFAGWFADAAVGLGAYPRLALSGLLTFFGSLNVAVPFLLDQFRIPSDTFQLFLASGVINSRFGTLVAAMHTLAVALIGGCAMTGTLRADRPRIARYLVITGALTVVVLGGARALFSYALPQHYTKDQVLAGMHLLLDGVPATVLTEPPADTGPAQGSVLDAIAARQRLRVGYLADSLPFAFVNGRGDLVGFDVELAHRLAAELNVGLEFVPIDRARLAGSLDAGLCDIVMSGVVITPERAAQSLFSASYLDETLGLLVEDADRSRFETWDQVRATRPLTIAVPGVAYYMDKMRQLVPHATLTPVAGAEDAIAQVGGAADALMLPAERGSAWTLIYPKYSVVVPGPAPIRMPLAYPVARRDQAFASFVNTWILLKQKDGTIDALYDYWVLGRRAQAPERRWSIIKDVLRWVE